MGAVDGCKLLKGMRYPRSEKRGRVGHPRAGSGPRRSFILSRKKGYVPAEAEYNEFGEDAMSQMTREASEVLAKAMQLSARERGFLIDQLIESLDEGPDEPGAEEAWAHEIKRRVDEIRSGKVKMIPGEEVERELAARLRRARE